ncbi:MAG TPA: ABC transporter substrate-binding protein [Anaerolineae bacterium]|nr:ABC transporter substrate-binding protein [Anaerolineae bacterium]
MSHKLIAVLVLVSVLALALAGCGPTPEPQIVERVVTQEVEKVVTVEVEKVVTQEVEVEVTSIVREEVEVLVTPEPQGAYQELARARAGEFAGTTVDIFGVYTGEDATRFSAALVPFEQGTGIDVNFEGSADFETLITVRVEAGDAPDIAQFSQPGLMRQFVDNLVPLDTFMNMDQLEQDYIQSWLDLATFDGTLYGLFYRAATKSIVWYPKPQFEAAGYQVPETWDELIALSDQIVADGGVPWCIPIEHGGSTGWVATDWVEDILLRTAPPEVYDQWVAHEIPFDNAEVAEAFDYLDDIWFNEEYVYGGREGILTIFVGQTAEMFPSEEEGREEPACWMMKQASWIPAFFPEGVAAGTDASFFYFPPIEEEYGSPVLGGGDPIGMFNDRPEVRAVMQYLATPQGAEVWVKTGGFISPNRSVPIEWYTNEVDRLQGEIMQNADVFRFDASDLMPGEVGVGTFWTGMIDWVSGAKDTATVLQDIEASWPE